MNEPRAHADASDAANTGSSAASPPSRRRLVKGIGRRPADAARRRPAGRAGRGRRVLTILTVAACLVVTVLCALMWCDVLVGNIVPVLQALTPVWVLAAGVLLVVAMLVRRRAVLLAAVPMLVAALAAANALASHPSPPTATRAAAGQRHLRVLSLNLEFGGADPQAVAAEVARVNPDVVIMPETTAAALRRLDRAGLGTRLRHRASGLVDDGSRGTAILSRYSVTTLDAGRRLGPYDLQKPVVSIAAPGADVVVRGVHAYPPLQDGVAQWRPQLDALGQWQRAQHASHLVMAGDFNASTAHPAFRHLREGLVDALPARHGSWPPTWPHGGVIPAFAQIDHILTRGFVPVDAGTFTVPGTDHAGVWSDLRY